MASAFYKTGRDCWIADFRGLRRGAKRRQTRIPADRIGRATPQADADAFALECERYCRLLEVAAKPDDVEHARKIGAITKPERDALLRGHAVPVANHQGPPTIRAAAIAHPSSQRDGLDQRRYLKYVDDFCSYSGVTLLSDLTAPRVMIWLGHLRAKDWAWDSRRHAILYLRRAARMAATMGLPDHLSDFRLDQREKRQRIERTWSLPEICRALKALAGVDDRARLAVALGACVGLRPTELLRLQVGDVAGDVLHVGERDHKTSASRRSLPLPATVAAWVKPVTGRRGRSAPLFATTGPRGAGAYTISGLYQWLTPILANHTDETHGPGHLRKAFATWSSAVISARDLERYLGHQTVLHAAVTARHYLAAHQVDELRPAALLLDASIVAALGRQGRKGD